MSSQIFIELESPSGDFLCMVDGGRHSVSMYLVDIKSGGNDTELVRVCNTREFLEFDNSWLETEEEPPITKEYCTEKSIISDLTEDRLKIVWANDKVSPILLLDGKPFAMIRHGETQGYSKAIKKAGEYGKPWNESIYNELT